MVVGSAVVWVADSAVGTAAELAADSVAEYSIFVISRQGIDTTRVIYSWITG